MKKVCNLFYGSKNHSLFRIALLTAIFLPAISRAQIIDPVLPLINKCEKAMGGRAAYNDIKHITWNFFGNRSLTWNKHNGDVRIDLRTENSIYLFNINSREGRIFKHGEELTQPDSVAKYINVAYEMWVNDSYWLVMPWKLKDPGVEHLYVGEMANLEGKKCEVIQLTFENTGVTPDNKYLIYFDANTNLVCQWDFYRSKANAAPLFSSIWGDYKEYAGVKFSGDRGERDISDIHVFSKLPDSVYKEFKRPFYLGR